MKCLDDAQVQALADQEVSADVAAHAASCVSCAARLEQRRALLSVAMSALDPPVPMPDALQRRVEQALAASATRGATRLRRTTGADGFWRRNVWSVAAAAAAALVVGLVVVPMVTGPATVSAAEILAKSANRLASGAGAGIELLEYELVLDGVPREMMPDGGGGGTYHFTEVIDHGSPGHFRYSSFAPDGRLLTSLAEDPVARTRVALLRVDEQCYRFELAMKAGDVPSLPELERLHMEATVAMMRASGQQSLQTVEGPDGPRYRVNVPQRSAATSDAVWDLSQAEVLIDASDFRIVEFSARGTLLKQPYSMSYRLISRQVVATTAPDAFEVPSEPGEIVIVGEGTASPATDVFFATLRELARARGVR
jgi:hypothetical protein